MRKVETAIHKDELANGEAEKSSQCLRRGKVRLGNQQPLSREA